MLYDAGPLFEQATLALCERGHLAVRCKVIQTEL